MDERVEKVSRDKELVTGLHKNPIKLTACQATGFKYSISDYAVSLFLTTGKERKVRERKRESNCVHHLNGNNQL